MAAKSSDEKKSHMVTIRMDRPMKAGMDKAAEATGRSLSGEIQHRLADYESMRSFVDRLLDDSAAIEVAVALKNLREAAGSRAISLESGEDLASLQRAAIAATCIAELFRTVAEHAGETLATGTKKWLADAWENRISAGDLSDDFDVETTAVEISAKISSHAKQSGKRLALESGPAVWPSVWDICFDKDDPLRSTSIRTGRGLMDMMGALPPAFQPPPQTEKERLAFIEKMKKGGAIRDAVKHIVSEGQHPGMSEDEVVDMLFDNLMTFDSELSEAAPNAKAS